MNARLPCLASMAADAYAHQLGKEEAAGEFWTDRAAREIRAGLQLKQPADWFDCRIPGPHGGWSPDELLLHALDCDNEPVRSVFSRVMVGQASAAELRTALVDFALEHCSEAIATHLEQRAKQEACHV